MGKPDSHHARPSKHVPLTPVCPQGFVLLHTLDEGRRANLGCGDPVPMGSLNHLVRLEEDGWGNGEAEGLGSLEVDDELELRGLLYREVGRFGAL